jgi:hypothetical protein
MIGEMVLNTPQETDAVGLATIVAGVGIVDVTASIAGFVSESETKAAYPP